MSTFAVDLRKWCDNTKAQANQVVREYIITLATKVIMRSPVDTGLFRGSWEYSTGRPSRVVGTRTDKAGNTVISEIRAAIPEKAAGLVHYISNNQPYGYRLEFESWSKQAPNGMVGISVVEFPQDIRRIVAATSQVAA